jgi:hypothetical protein
LVGQEQAGTDADGVQASREGIGEDVKSWEARSVERRTPPG